MNHDQLEIVVVILKTARKHTTNPAKCANPTQFEMIVGMLLKNDCIK